MRRVLVGGYAMTAPNARSTTSDATPYRDAYLRLRAAGLTQINALRLASAGYDVLAMVPAVALALLPAPPVTPVAAPMSVVSAPPTLDGPTTPAPPRVSRSTHRPPLPTPSTSPLRGWQRWTSLNWRALARCESTNNPRAVDPSGTYYGLYQFDGETWRSVGGVGSPADATPAEQTYRAELLYADRGRAPWPVCGYRLGDPR